LLLVRDKNGQALAYVYFEEEPGDGRRPRRSPATMPGASPPTLLKPRELNTRCCPV
jgi:hypothetical protein